MLASSPSLLSGVAFYQFSSAYLQVAIRNSKFTPLFMQYCYSSFTVLLKLFEYNKELVLFLTKIQAEKESFHSCSKAAVKDREAEPGEKKTQ